MYAKWAEAYKRETGVGLNYQSIGSSAVFARSAQDRGVWRPMPHCRALRLEKDGMVQFLPSSAAPCLW